MRVNPRAGLSGLATTAVVAALFSPLGTGSPAAAQPGAPSPSGGDVGVTGVAPGSDDTREVGPDLRLNATPEELQAQADRLNERLGTSRRAKEGDKKFFITYDIVKGDFLSKYELRSMGENIEVWVAVDTRFPAGDCRNGLGLTKITTKQTDSFVEEFDDNILPAESESFSVAPAKDGSGATLPGQIDGEDGEADPIPDGYYTVGADQADNVVTLVSNVRDENYYTPDTPDGQTYIAGFFSTGLNSLFGRNVMSIDAFDWRHRTGENPPDDTKRAAYRACSKELGRAGLGTASPRQYEGTFAHEYQHLLESYEDADEETWVNEGLSDYAQSLVGYVDTTLPPSDRDFDGHLACFQGFLPRSFGGAENSLTRWEDQGGPETLCDYGAVYSFMEYLEGLYGEPIMTFLHRDDANGLASVDDALNSVGASKSAQDTVRDWAAMVALDAPIDRGGELSGGTAADLTSDNLSSRLRWDNPQLYNTPGAPSNGSDYVRVRAGKGDYLSAGQLRSLTFEGSPTLAPDPLRWTVDRRPPGNIPTGDETCGEGVEPGPRGPALYSGCKSNRDAGIARTVTVPATGDATLSFDVNYDLETGYDFGFAQVSDDGGRTWTSLETEDTVGPEAAETDVPPSTRDMLPGFNGESNGFRTQTADLSQYAGQEVVIGFRTINDPLTNEAGMWVRDVSVGEESLPTNTLDGWQSYTQVAPTEVPGYTLQLVAIDRDTDDTWFHRVPLGEDFTADLDRAELNEVLGTDADLVAALVMMDDPEEALTKYGPYSLIVNGKRQPGGGQGGQ